MLSALGVNNLRLDLEHILGILAEIECREGVQKAGSLIIGICPDGAEGI